MAFGWLNRGRRFLFPSPTSGSGSLTPGSAVPGVSSNTDENHFPNEVGEFSNLGSEDPRFQLIGGFNQPI